MKRIQKLAVALFSMMAMSAAQADTISMIDSTAAGTDTYLVAGSPTMGSTSFTLSFLDLAAPYVAGVDAITKATLKIILKDDGNQQGGSETFQFNFGNETKYGSNQSNAPTTYTYDLTTALADLSTYGFLNVSIFANAGDFRFNFASLEIEGTRGVVILPPDEEEVPEPLSIALMGLGLAGLTAARRRK